MIRAKRMFEIPGKIQAKQRPRFNKKFAYTPANTVNYENWVKTCYLQNYKGEKLLENALKVQIDAFYEIPKSTSLKKKELMLDGEILPTIKPDTDNVAKSIQDALNGIAFKDDKQVVELLVKKCYSTEPRAVVTIEEV